MYLQYNIIYENYYDDDDLTEAVLYMGDYFAENDIENVNILVPKLTHSYVYSLIYTKNIERFNFEYSDTNYTELMQAVGADDIDYVLVDKEETNRMTITNIDENMKILYQNHNFIFFEVK